jgi:hypothetical protein
VLSRLFPRSLIKATFAGESPHHLEDFFIEEDFAQEGEQGRFRDCGCNRTRIQAVET